MIGFPTNPLNIAPRATGYWKRRSGCDASWKRWRPTGVRYRKEGRCRRTMCSTASVRMAGRGR